MTAPDAFERMLETAPRERLVLEIRTNIEALAEVMQEVPRWTPVTQEPPEGGRYLVCGPSAYHDRTVLALAYFKWGFSCDWDVPVEMKSITHWMSLPALPQGDKETK